MGNKNNLYKVKFATGVSCHVLAPNTSIACEKAIQFVNSDRDPANKLSEYFIEKVKLVSVWQRIVY